MRRALVFLGSGLALALSGCPVTDDYYLEAGAGRAEAGKTAVGGAGSTSASGGVGAREPQGGKTAVGGADTSALGGAPDVGSAGQPEAGDAGAPAVGCVAKTERCNGHDDDCDELSDELACNVQGTYGCSGFTLPRRPDHGYMLCSGNNQKAWSAAKEACQAQNMRLAWLETEDENTGVAAKISALGVDSEVLLGGTDQVQEGNWYWDGGGMFWQGLADGESVGGAFEAWIDSTPNNTNNEDCLLFFPDSAGWGDRVCSANYPFLCEEHEPLE
jgi:hypothetical protein